MSEAGDVEDRSDGHLIKVLEVLDGGEAFLGRTANGGTARFSLGQLADIRRGSVVFVSEDRWGQCRSVQATYPLRGPDLEDAWWLGLDGC